MKILRIQIFTFVLFFTTFSLFSGDWPMWRYDSERSGASPHNIAENPVLLWSRKLPPVRKAWPFERKNRLDFDASYEPIISGKLLFIASPNDGTVSAFDTDSGERKWKFYTEGPVRCAPVCFKNKIIFGSDDGYLYCLNSKTGKLVWKFRGAPEDRPDRRQIGNNHLVSFWPVRGGPVIKNNIVYFGSGIWPSFGIFIYAVDAETGKVKWMNNRLNYIANVRLDHDILSESGLSPQGSFVAIGKTLLVPNGRSMPAGLELETGELIYYAQGARNGDSQVAAHGDYGFVGRTGVINLYDFREVGSRWAKRGNQAPEGYDPHKWYKQTGLNESPGRVPYKNAVACDSSSAFKQGVSYGIENGVFHAHDLLNSKISEKKPGPEAFKHNPLLWEPPRLWQFITPFKGPSCPVIIAGKRIYASVKRKIIALENTDGKRKIAWMKDLKGSPSSIAAADGKLFVATKEGWIHCFGEGQKGEIYNKKPIALKSKNDKWKKKSEEILKKTGVKSGYCLVLGLDDGRLVEEIIENSNMNLLVVDSDKSKIDKIRQRLDSAGLLGSRVECFTENPFSFLFPPYIASLIISENQISSNQLKKIDLGKLFESLRPYGGTLFIEFSEKGKTEFVKTIKSAKLAQAIVKRAGEFLMIKREGAPSGSASWTHQKGDAAGTSCSPDKLVRAPLGCLWYGDLPGNRSVLWKAGIGGRVYALLQHRNAILLCYDAYTGRFLWKNQIEGSMVRFAAMRDSIYAAANGKCFMFDPENGNLLQSFTFGNDEISQIRDIRVDGNSIILACTRQKKYSMYDLLMVGVFADTLICLDRRSGKEKWRKSAKNSFNTNALVLDKNMVFCIDSQAFERKWLDKQRKGIPTITESILLAINAETGEIAWSKNESYELPNRHGKGSIGVRSDWIAYSTQKGILVSGRFKTATGYEARTGKKLWKNKKVYFIRFGYQNFRPTPLIVWNGKFCFSEGTTFDMVTGKRVKSIFKRDGHGCNNAVASENLVMLRDSTVSYTDIQSGEIYHTRNVKSGCWNSLLAADGVLQILLGNYICECNYPVQTYLGLVHMPEVEKWAGSEPVLMTAPKPRPNP